MLKKTLITTLLLFTATVAAYSQMVVSPKVGVGMISSPDLNYFYVYQDSNYNYIQRSESFQGSWKTSFNAGVGLDYFLTDYTAFIAELTLAGPHKPRNKNYFYLTLPVGVRQYINENIFLGGGLYYTYAVNFTINDPMDNYGLFADIGTGFHLPNGDMLLLYGRYSFGKYHRGIDLWRDYSGGNRFKYIKWGSVALTVNIAYGFRL